MALRNRSTGHEPWFTWAPGKVECMARTRRPTDGLDMQMVKFSIVPLRLMRSREVRVTLMFKFILNISAPLSFLSRRQSWQVAILAISFVLPWIWPSYSLLLHLPHTFLHGVFKITHSVSNTLNEHIMYTCWTVLGMGMQQGTKQPRPSLSWNLYSSLNLSSQT